MTALITVADIQLLPRGGVRCLFLEPITSDWKKLLVAESLPVARMAACHLPAESRLDAILDAGMQQLAALAALIWPDWYGETSMPLMDSSRNDTVNAETLLRLAAIQERICLHWLQAAAALCCAGQAPLLSKLHRALQTQQLALALMPEDLLLLFIHDSLTASPIALQSLAHAANWFARQTQARVLLVLPMQYQGHTSLDRVNYQALLRSIPPPPEIPPASVKQPKTNAWIWPLIGRPHPSSPGEQLLAKVLATDAQLKSLFEFNVWVHSVRGQRFLVDLLWRVGRLVVEIDGYHFHSDPAKFSSDRQRDYELLLSGYAVLRLPHDEVVADVAVAIAKIRDLVQFQHAHPRSNLD